MFTKADYYKSLPDRKRALGQTGMVWLLSEPNERTFNPSSGRANGIYQRALLRSVPSRRSVPSPVTSDLRRDRPAERRNRFTIQLLETTKHRPLDLNLSFDRVSRSCLRFENDADAFAFMNARKRSQHQHDPRLRGNNRSAVRAGHVEHCSQWISTLYFVAQ